MQTSEDREAAKRYIEFSREVRKTHGFPVPSNGDGGHIQEQPVLDPVIAVQENLYSPSNLNVLGMLLQIRCRPNPTYDLGNVDTRAALLVCDNELPDAPIIYATDSFEELTGYSGSEIKGRNCRFLQNPPASAAVLMEDPEIVLRFQKYNEPLLSELRHRIAKGEEGQVKIVNYRKDGRPFFNILTVIPITFKDMDGSERKLIVGFQVDEKDIKGFLG